MLIIEVEINAQFMADMGGRGEVIKSNCYENFYPVIWSIGRKM